MSALDHIPNPEAEIARLRRIIVDREEEIERLTQKLQANQQLTFLPPRSWRLTETERLSLQTLCAVAVASRSRLFEATRATGRGWRKHDVDPKVVDVYICRLRRKLQPLGFEIHTAIGCGWSIDAEQRLQLVAMCNGADR